MRVVLAPDSFKGSLTAAEVCRCVEEGIRRLLPDADIISVPMADGGEGTVDAMVAGTHGRFVTVAVAGPLGQTLQALYGILGDEKTAVIEMAAASGLPLVPVEKRNPLKTTTYGTGQLMLDALGKGCRRIIIGIGGSATTDGGAGMAQALGVKFFDNDGREISEYMNGELLGNVAHIDLGARHPGLNECDITVACDVDNPLLGPRGAVMVYSRQKGATDEQLQILERNMASFIGVVEKSIGRRVRDIPGTGAAGGLGAGLVAFTEAGLKPGVQLVLQACHFEEKIRNADLIITGEGAVDRQTAYGKTISGVCAKAQKERIPVIVIAGSLGSGSECLYDLGVTAMFSICDRPMPLEEAIKNAGHLVTQCAERVMRLLLHRL